MIIPYGMAKNKYWEGGGGDYCIKLKVYFGNLTPGIHFNKPISCQLKSITRPIFVHFDQ